MFELINWNLSITVGSFYSLKFCLTLVLVIDCDPIYQYQNNNLNVDIVLLQGKVTQMA